jgi:hypothetical protein
MDLAGEYQRRYPDAITDPAQREERMQRLRLNEERRALRRTTRTRGIALRWLPLDENGRLKR